MNPKGTLRQKVEEWAKWGVRCHGYFTYSEGPERMSNMDEPGTLPIISDCSAWVTRCYKWAGAADPNGLGYNGEGYTGTLLAHGQHIPLSEAEPGDVIVYGPGTGWHTALLVHDFDGTFNQKDPLTVSMGQQGDPSFVRVSQDGRLPQNYLRFLPIEKPSRAVVMAALGKKPARIFKFADVAAIKQFQRDHGLLADGIVGPLTTAVMHKLGLI